MFGSSVLPDLLETIKRVLPRSIFPSVCLICAGSVESSTCNRGKPCCWPKVSARTSGQRLDPPMPSSRMCRKPPYFAAGPPVVKVFFYRIVQIGRKFRALCSDVRRAGTLGVLLDRLQQLVE